MRWTMLSQKQQKILNRGMAGLTSVTQISLAAVLNRLRSETKKEARRPNSSLAISQASNGGGSDQDVSGWNCQICARGRAI